MDYTDGEKTYTISYQELKNEYDRFCSMSDQEFQQNALEATHLACIICFFKELPNYLTLGDSGIIHELIHLQTGNIEITIEELRDLFKNTLQLV